MSFSRKTRTLFSTKKVAGLSPLQMTAPPRIIFSCGFNDIFRDMNLLRIQFFGEGHDFDPYQATIHSECNHLHFIDILWV
jgi:hypothetical protein